MKILIVYASKTGTTEKCANLLKDKLSADIVNLDSDNVDISKYDTIIIGGAIRVGQISGSVKRFIKQNSEVLDTKRVALFICCAFQEDSENYFKNNFSAELLDKALCYDNFGGELDLAKQRGIDKLIVKLVKKTDKGKSEITILNDNIDLFVKKVETGSD